MIVSEKKLENSRMELQIEVPEDKIESEYTKVFDRIQKNAKIDGFRKGKVPLEVIIKKFQGSADSEVAENIVRSSYMEALNEKKLYPISEPEVNFDNKIERLKPLKYTVKFDISPTIELGEYKNLSVKENECKIVNSDIENELQMLRERYATVSKKEKGEPAEKDDYVRAEIKIIDTNDKSEAVNTDPKQISVIIGKGTEDYDFDDDIIGMKVDDDKEVAKKYAKDYTEKELAGKKVKYLLKVLEISKLNLPSLDDEFAKDLGDFKTLDDVRNKIKEDFEGFSKAKAKTLVNKELINKIQESSKFDLPESMILREMESLKYRIESNMGGRGIDELFSKGVLNKEDFTKRIREEAVQNIKSTLTLLEIAKKENLKVPEEKYKDLIKSYSEKSAKSIEEIEKDIEVNSMRENIETELLLEIANDFIYDNSSIKKLKPVSFDEFKKL